ncbi:MAG: hypothetical protein WCY97_04780 [Methanothrix sp.]|nr:hypothetical protein [Methanothrix sp.]MDD3710412.1 hypothetical protein [Methanothrix sp.]MDD5768360.1 hypothetical protein [Methanothrix sp.]MDI9399117.1 hypothetical protein [Euryarchaeota archaeon]
MSVVVTLSVVNPAFPGTVTPLFMTGFSVTADTTPFMHFMNPITGRFPT